MNLLKLSSPCHQVTSRWTTFEGTCAQYEFLFNAKIDFVEELPWKLMENSKFCIKGVFTEAGQVTVNLLPGRTQSEVDVQVAFRWVYSP